MEDMEDMGVDLLPKHTQNHNPSKKRNIQVIFEYKKSFTHFLLVSTVHNSQSISTLSLAAGVVIFGLVTIGVKKLFASSQDDDLYEELDSSEKEQFL